MVFKPRANTQVSAMLILKRGNQILFSRRANTGHCDGLFSLPAGRVELRESIRDCIIREAKEEINITINKNDLEFVHFMHRFEPENSFDYSSNIMNECLDFYFITYKWKGNIKNNEPHKCSELKWFTKEDCHSHIPYICHAIDYADARIMYSEY